MYLMVQVLTKRRRTPTGLGLLIVGAEKQNGGDARIFANSRTRASKATQNAKAADANEQGVTRHTSHDRCPSAPNVPTVSKKQSHQHTTTHPSTQCDVSRGSEEAPENIRNGSISGDTALLPPSPAPRALASAPADSVDAGPLFAAVSAVSGPAILLPEERGLISPQSGRGLPFALPEGLPLMLLPLPSVTAGGVAVEATVGGVTTVVLLSPPVLVASVAAAAVAAAATGADAGGSGLVTVGVDAIFDDVAVVGVRGGATAALAVASAPAAAAAAAATAAAAAAAAAVAVAVAVAASSCAVVIDGVGVVVAEAAAGSGRPAGDGDDDDDGLSGVIVVLNTHDVDERTRAKRGTRGGAGRASRTKRRVVMWRRKNKMLEK